MEAQELTLLVGGVHLMRSTDAAVVFNNLSGRNFAGEENRDKSYSQHLITFDFMCNGAKLDGRISFAPGVSLQLLTPSGEVLEQSIIAHHANLAAMPVELILPQAAEVDDDSEGWALFIADQPLSGHFTSMASDGRYRAGVRWGRKETEDYLLFNAAAAGAKLQLACSRKEVAEMCLQGREGGDALLAMPAQSFWSAISEEREKIVRRPYGEVVTLLAHVRTKAKKVA